MQVAEQVDTLSKYEAPFSEAVEKSLGIKAIEAGSLTTLQMNLGKLCNQACKHCHVDAGPGRTENMKLETVEQCLDIIRSVDSIQTVDVTGGAPEMNQYFRYLITETKKAGKHIIDRCNLTILEEEGYEWVYDFLVENDIEIVASLPYFAASKTDKQRGNGVFDKSITALQKLNKLGYGNDRSLSLVYNPTGLFLSGSQTDLKQEFKAQLKTKYDIVFNNLYCINNVPINRFLLSLVRKEKFEEYMKVLVNAFNPATVEGLMCRHQMSVSYEGYIYDCDFNQMLDMTVEEVSHVKDFNLDKFIHRSILVNSHCYACTAGAGSSCGGELV